MVYLRQTQKQVCKVCLHLYDARGLKNHEEHCNSDQEYEPPVRRIKRVPKPAMMAKERGLPKGYFVTYFLPLIEFATEYACMFVRSMFSSCFSFWVSLTILMVVCFAILPVVFEPLQKIVYNGHDLTNKLLYTKMPSFAEFFTPIWSEMMIVQKSAEYNQQLYFQTQAQELCNYERWSAGQDGEGGAEYWSYQDCIHYYNDHPEQIPAQLQADSQPDQNIQLRKPRQQKRAQQDLESQTDAKEYTDQQQQTDDKQYTDQQSQSQFNSNKPSSNKPSSNKPSNKPSSNKPSPSINYDEERTKQSERYQKEMGLKVRAEQDRRKAELDKMEKELKVRAEQDRRKQAELDQMEKEMKELKVRAEQDRRKLEEIKEKEDRRKQAEHDQIRKDMKKQREKSEQDRQNQAEQEQRNLAELKEKEDLRKQAERDQRKLEELEARAEQDRSELERLREQDRIKSVEQDKLRKELKKLKDRQQQVQNNRREAEAEDRRKVLIGSTTPCVMPVMSQRAIALYEEQKDDIWNDLLDLSCNEADWVEARRDMLYTFKTIACLRRDEFLPKNCEVLEPQE